MRTFWISCLGVLVIGVGPASAQPPGEKGDSATWMRQWDGIPLEALPTQISPSASRSHWFRRALRTGPATAPAAGRPAPAASARAPVPAQPSAPPPNENTSASPPSGPSAGATEEAEPPAAALPETAPAPVTPPAVSNAAPAAPPPTAPAKPAEDHADTAHPRLAYLMEPVPAGPWWVSADYLIRWLQRDSVPGPLLVVGPASSNGIAGAPGTTVFGNDSAFLNSGPFSGVQLSAGRSLGEVYGLELSAFILEQRNTGHQAGSDAAGNPVVSLPFVNEATSASDRFLAAFPGFYAGSATISHSTRLWGGEANLSRTAFNNCHGCGQLLAGFRYLNLQEQLGVQSTSADIPPNGFTSFNGALLPSPSQVTTADSFSTQNNFYGGQIGGRLEWRWRMFFLNTTGLVALGLTDEIVGINGFSTATPPGASTPLTALGGLYAQPSNIGRTNRAEFAVVPQWDLTVGAQLTQRLRVYVGYNILYWSSVVRPGSQINPVINLAQPPLSSQFGPVTPPTQPLPVFHSSDFWAQGVDIGLAFRF